MRFIYHQRFRGICFPFIILLMVLSASFVLAQAPQAFKYQAVIRDAQGFPIVESSVNVRISILAGGFVGETFVGDEKYIEVHITETSSGGLITLNIGEGTPQQGSFAGIDWGIAEYFAKVEVDIDPQGVENYLEMGISQLLSVPYALYARHSYGPPSYTWDSLQLLFPNPAPGMMAFVKDEAKMAFFDGLNWVFLGACPPNTIADAGNGGTHLPGNTFQLSGNFPDLGNIGNWSIMSGAGGSFSSVFDPQATFTGVPGTEYTLRWTMTTVCEENFDEIQVGFCYTLTIANAGPDQLNILSDNTILAGNPPGNGNIGVWTFEGQSGYINEPNAFNSAFEGLPGHVYTLTWTISTDCDDSSDQMVLSFCHLLTQAYAGEDQLNFDGNSVYLDASVPGNGNTGYWQVVSGSGNYNFADQSDPKTQFTGDRGVIYELSWTTSTDCNQSDTDFVTISFCPVLVQAVAGEDVTNVCSPYQLSGNNPGSGNNGLWTILEGESGSLQNETSPNAILSGLPNETYLLKWAISNNCGTTSSTVTIQFEPLPTVADAGPSQENIAGTSVFLAGNTPVNGSGLWTVISGQGGTFTDATDPGTEFSGQPATLYVLEWKISNSCGASYSSNTVVRFCPVPTVAEAGENQTNVCNPYQLTGNEPGFGNFGEWAIVDGTAAGVVSPTNSYNAMLYGEPGASYTLSWTISNPCCLHHSQDVVNISFDPLPTPAMAGPDQLDLETTTTTLVANTPSVGTGAWTIIEGQNGIILDINNPTSQFTGVTGEYYRLEWRISTACYHSADTVDISFITPFVCGMDFTDPRDQQVYPTVQIGTRCWMAKNLNTGNQIFTPSTPSNNGQIEKYCFNNQSSYCESYGGLYTWNEAMNYSTTQGAQGICPSGWHIPTKNEWTSLLTAVGSEPSCKMREVGNTYWNNNSCATNSSGFSARGGGFLIGNFDQLKESTYFWTSTGVTSNADSYLFMSSVNDVYEISNPKSYSFYIRCIKNN